MRGKYASKGDTGADFDSVAAFVRTAISGLSGRHARVALFYTVRNLPYATDAASDAPMLVRLRRGNCLAKADLLTQAFALLKYQTRMVRWLYRLPDAPAEVAALPSHDDIHTAVEILIEGQWQLIDATHDPSLGCVGFVVSEWDGIHSTLPGYVPRGPLWHVGVDNDAIAEAVEAIAARYTDEANARAATYRVAFNNWLDAVRVDGCLHGSGVDE